MHVTALGTALALVWLIVQPGGGHAQAIAAGAACRQPLFMPLHDAAGLPKIENRVAVALKRPIGQPYRGSSSSAYLKAARGDMIDAIYLGTFVTLTDRDRGTKARDKLRRILLNWAGTVAPKQFATDDGPGSARADYAGLGLYVGWIGIGAAFGYDILRCHGALATHDDGKIRTWLRRIASAVLEGRRRWVTSNYFGGQLANNHLSMHNLAVFTVGAALDDQGLMRWAYDSPDNSFNFVKSIGAIIYSGQERDAHDANQSLPRRGEIYDRYRMDSGDGLHYAFVQLLMLGLLADISSRHGHHPFAIAGPHGETLKDAFLYYGQVLATSHCDIKTPPLVPQDSNRAFYANAKVEAVYWNWIIPIKRHFRNDPEVRPLIARIDRARCDRPAAEYTPVPFIAALYQ